jgi:hypothetical protein
MHPSTGSVRRRLAVWTLPLPFVPLLALALAGCGADTSTTTAPPPGEQAQQAEKNMEEFMKNQGKTPKK